MDLGLKGKVSLVTAASRGIGLGVARVLAEEGCKVVISSRNIEELSKAAKRLASETGNNEILPIAADLTSKEDIERLAKETRSHFGSVEVLAYNTGPPKPGTFRELSSDDWEYATKLLILSAVWLTQKVVPTMVERKWGRLVYITSLTLKHPLANLVLSNTLRLSIAGLSKSLSMELGSSGITSNGILQGHILTDRVTQLSTDASKRTGKSIEQIMADTIRDVPAARFGKPEEIGYLAAFLASDRASYINGTMLNVDGGLIRSVF